MKFVSASNKEIEANEIFNCLDVDAFPFLDKPDSGEELASIIFDEKTYTKEDLFLLKINVDEIGTFKFFFDKNILENKEKLFEDIKALKHLEVTKKEIGIEKINKLFELIKPHNPLLCSYKAKGGLPLEKEELSLISDKLLTFFLIKDRPQKIKSIKIPFSLKKILENSLFAVLSGLLIGLTFALGLYNSYASNGTAVIFFICTVVGAGLSGYVYLDLYKLNSFLSIKNLILIVVSIGSTIGGVGLFYVLRLLFKEIIENEPPFYLYALISLAILLLSIAAGYVINVFIKKKKK